MDRQIIWTESAWSDLDEAADFIARDSAYYAAAFVLEARDVSRILKSQPQIGRMVPELNNPAIRELLVGSYRLIYQIKSDRVYILGFIHGARDLPSLWKREGGSRAGDTG
jgi:plasmid stabilization system protein ParE